MIGLGDLAIVSSFFLGVFFTLPSTFLGVQELTRGTPLSTHGFSAIQPVEPTPSSPLFQDYESCVRRGDKECTYVDGDERDDFGQLTEFFCGQEDDCT